LRDELHEPLGRGPDPAPQAKKGAAVALIAAAVSLTSAIVLAEASLTYPIRWQDMPTAVALAPNRPAAPEKAPPLRLAEAPPARSAAPALAEEAAPRTPVRPARIRAGAPEPLVIDVRQALASLRARERAAADR
jgi:hypothetical protein